MSGLHHLELRPRSLRPTARPPRLCRKQTQKPRAVTFIRSPTRGGPGSALATNVNYLTPRISMIMMMAPATNAQLGI